MSHPDPTRPGAPAASAAGASSAGTPGTAIADLERAVDHLRDRVRRLRIAEAALAAARILLATALALVLLDYLLRLPASVRGLLLAGLATLAVLLVRRRVLPALRLRPSRTDLALRLERLEPALAGRLASALEFHDAGAERTDPLVAASLRRTAELARGVRLEGHADVRAVRRGGLRTLVPAGCVLLGLLFAPGLVATGSARLLAPWSDATWPARTAVASLMDEVTQGRNVHPRGTVLPLRALNLTANDPEGRVRASYRLVEDGRRGSEVVVALTHQGDAERPDGTRGGLHERLVDTAGAEAIEVRFSTADATTRVERIRLEPSPAILASTLRALPPAYAEGLELPLEQALGTGTDARARSERPVLAGAAVRLELELAKPLLVPDAAAERAAFVRSVFGWEDAPGPDFTADGTRWTLLWTADRTRRLDVVLADADGLENDEPIRFAIEVREDRPPAAVMTEPEADGIALATAVLPLAGEASDDVGVAEARLRAAIGRAGSTAIDTDFVIEATEVSRRVVAEGPIDLAPLGLEPGDVVELSVEARDLLMASRGVEPIRSSVRRVRIVRERDLAGELRSMLSAVRRAAIRLEVMQGDLQDQVAERTGEDAAAAEGAAGVDAAMVREQARIGERLQEQLAAVDEIAERLEQNRLDDQALEGLLRQAAERLSFAAGASAQATGALERAPASDDAAARPDANDDRDEDAGGDEAASADEDADGAVREASAAQQAVREELVDLVRLLDRDEDTWLVRQEVDRIEAAQEELQEATRKLAERLLGRERSELDEREQRALADLAEPQAELADAMRRLVEEMRRRARAMEPVDPQAAAQLREAADVAEANEVAREMRQAADDAGESRLQNAEEAQQRALEALEEMAEAMEEDPRARTLELLRRLGSLEASIERLVSEQEDELVRLDRARLADRLDGRDRAMVRLGQNTLAVAAEARTAGPESRPVARVLDRAADEQAQAVAFLREVPPDWAEAQSAEEASLEALVEALGIARGLAEEARQEQARQARDEIIEAYRGELEKQVALRAITEPLVEAADERGLDRRERFELRRLGNVQEEIRVALDGIRTSSNDLANSSVLDFVHDRLDALGADAARAMWDGEATILVLDLQGDLAEGIRRQIDALEAAQAAEEEFDAPNQGAGGAGGGGRGGEGQSPPVIPPATELKRLAGLQAEVLRDTRRLAERPGLDEAVRAARTRAVAEFQQDVLSLAQSLLEQLESPGTRPGEETPDGDDADPVGPERPDREETP